MFTHKQVSKFIVTQFKLLYRTKRSNIFWHYIISNIKTINSVGLCQVKFEFVSPLTFIKFKNIKTNHAAVVTLSGD